MEVISEEEMLWDVGASHGTELTIPGLHIRTRGVHRRTSGFLSHRPQSSQLLSAGVQPPWQAGTQSAGIGPLLHTVPRAGTELQSKDCDSELGEALGSLGFLGGSVVKNPPAHVGDLGLIPGSGRSPSEGCGNLLQYSCLENPMDQRSLSGYGPWGCKESMRAHTGFFGLRPRTCLTLFCSASGPSGIPAGLDT